MIFRRFTDVPQFDTQGKRVIRLGLGYRRFLAEKAFDLAQAKYGDDHPATLSALGRFVALWGEDFLKVYDVPVPESSEILDKSLYRESGVEGHLNKGMRKHVARTNAKPTA